MRTTSFRLPASACCLALLLLAQAGASATSIAPKLPLLERVARGTEKVPESLQVSVGTVAWRRGKEHRITLTAAQRELLGRLVVAHKENLEQPFREALASSQVWLQQIALDGLPHGRLSHGSEGSQLALAAARREDLAFVARFLPALSELARVPAASKDGVWISPRAELAQECLGFLARLAHDQALAGKAIAALVEALATRPTRAGLEVLNEALEARPELRLSASQKETLIPVIRAQLRLWLSYGQPEAPLVSLDAPAIAARLDDALTLDLVAQVFWDVKRYDFVHHLAAGGHPQALRATRHALRHTPLGAPYGRPFQAAGILRDPTLIPDIEARSRRCGTSVLAMDALLAIGTTAGFVAIERRMEADVLLARREQGYLAASADAWLQTNPPDPERLRKHIKTLPAIERTRLLRVMVKHGTSDLLPAIRSYLVKPTVPVAVQVEAMRALGAYVLQTQDPVALALLLNTAEEALRAWVADYGQYARAALYNVATNTLAENGRFDPALRTRLLAWWSLMNAGKWRTGRSQLLWVLGHVGDARTLEFLRPLCTFGGGAGDRVRLMAREATGRIEARLAQQASPR